MHTTIRAYLELFRIVESQLIAGSAAITLILLGISDLARIFLLFIVLLTGASGIFAWNDSLDIKEDTIAHPERPIISGRISIIQARTVGTVLITVSLVASTIFSLKLFYLGITGITIGISYSLTSKSRFVLIAPMKNIVVVGTTALLLMLIPNTLNIQPDLTYYIFVLSLSSILFGYEILKDIRDVSGDSVAGYNTLPIRNGIAVSAKISAFFIAVSCVVMGITFFTIGYLQEAWITTVTTFLVLIPFKAILNDPVPEKSDITRVAVLAILLVSLLGVTTLLYLRLIN